MYTSKFRKLNTKHTFHQALISIKYGIYIDAPATYTTITENDIYQNNYGIFTMGGNVFCKVYHIDYYFANRSVGLSLEAL